MRDEHYNKALDAALVELKSLTGEQAKLRSKLDMIESRIIKVRDAAQGLGILAGVDLATLHPQLFPKLIDTDVGLTDAIRIVLKNQGDFMSPIQVRDGLSDASFPINEHKQPLASIHTVLKRLAENDEVQIAIDEVSGKTVYGWMGTKEARERLARHLESDEDIEYLKTMGSNKK